MDAFCEGLPDFKGSGKDWFTYLYTLSYSCIGKEVCNNFSLEISGDILDLGLNPSRYFVSLFLRDVCMFWKACDDIENGQIILCGHHVDNMDGADIPLAPPRSWNSGRVRLRKFQVNY